MKATSRLCFSERQRWQILFLSAADFEQDLRASSASKCTFCRVSPSLHFGRGLGDVGGDGERATIMVLWTVDVAVVGPSRSVTDLRHMTSST